MIYSYEMRPIDFTSTKRVVTLLLFVRGTLLLLRRAAGKPHAKTLGAPGGKVDPGEREIVALIREVREETGIDLTPWMEQLVAHPQLCVRSGPLDFLYFSWELTLPERPRIILSPTEHTADEWHDWRTLKPHELVPDMYEALRRHYGPLAR